MSRHQPEGRPDTVTDVVHKTYLRALGSAADCAAELEPGVVLDTALLSGPPAQALAETAACASMLVVGSRGAGMFAALVLGSVSRYVASHAGCPVVVAHEESLAVHREIVIGVGDLDQPDAPLRFAFEEAALRKARLLVVHAWSWAIPGTGPLGTLTAAERAAIDSSQMAADTAARLEDLLASFREAFPEVQADTEVIHAHPGRPSPGLLPAPTSWCSGAIAPGQPLPVRGLSCTRCWATHMAQSPSSQVTDLNLPLTGPAC